MKKVLFFVAIFLAFSCVSYSNSELYQGKLKNGLVYRIYESSQLPIISINIKIKAGSYFDKKFGESSVLSNCLESCSKKNLDAERFREMVDMAGGKISVSSSKEYIDIDAKFPLSKAEKAFCLLSEMFKSDFDDKKNFQFSKREPYDYLKSLQNDKDYLAIHAAFVNLIKQQAYSHTSLGSFEGLKSIKNDDVREFFLKHVGANNAVLSVSGGIKDKKQIEKLIKRYFSSLRKSDKSIYEPVKFFNKSHIENIVKHTNQSYVYMAFRSFSDKDKRHYAAKILAFILGGNLNSILAKDVRTKHGYAYSVFAFNYGLTNGGMFVVGFQTQNKFTLKALNLVFEDIKNIDKFITKKRVDDAKRYLIGKNSISMQSSISVAHALSYGYMLGDKVLPWEQFRKNIDMVTKDDVINVANSIFNHVSVGIVSEKNYKNEIKKLIDKYGY